MRQANSSRSFQHLCADLVSSAQGRGSCRCGAADRSAFPGSAATLWLDHILLSEYAVTNTDAPSIVITDSKTTVNAGESAYLTAKISQDHGTAPVRPNRVRAYIDGKLSSATYHTSSAAIDVKTGKLSAGTHVIVLEAEDDAGNRRPQVGYCYSGHTH